MSAFRRWLGSLLDEAGRGRARERSDAWTVRESIWEALQDVRERGQGLYRDSAGVVVWVSR